MLVRKKDVEDCPRKRMCIIAVVQKKARKAGKEMGMVQLDNQYTEPFLGVKCSSRQHGDSKD